MLNQVDKFFLESSKKTRITISISAIGLLLFLVVATLFPFKDQLFNRLFPKPPSQALTQTSAEKIINLNMALKEQKTKYLTAQGKNKEDALTLLQQIVTQRKEILLEIFKTDPEQVSSLFFPEDQRSGLPPQIENSLEKRIEIEGEIKTLIIEDFEKKESQTLLFLKTQDMREYNLFLAKKDIHFSSGTKVRVKGILLDQNLAASGPSNGDVTILEYAAVTIPTDKKVAIILVNFQNDTRQPYTKEYTQTILNFAAAYYNEVSFGKLTLSGDIYGYYTLPIDATCNDIPTHNEIIKAADSDIYFPNYTTVVMVTNQGCGGGRAYVGPVDITTADGIVNVGDAWVWSMAQYVFTHELGHTFDLWHANFYNCGIQAIQNTGCTSVEYGDQFDVMGSWNTYHLNGYYKEKLGFFNPPNVVNVASSGTYTIAPIEVAASGPQILKIIRSDGSFLYIEYRQPLGFDAALPSQILDGAFIHFIPYPIVDDNPHWVDTKIIDATPTDPSSEYDVSLEVGKTLVDPQVAAITTTNQTPAALTLNIDLLLPIYTSISSPQNGSVVSGSTNVSISAIPSAGVRVNQVELYRDGKYNLLATLRKSPYNFVWDSTKTSNGLHTLRAFAYASGKESFASAPVVVNVQNTPTPPPVQNYGNITGTVYSSAGGTVPGVKITLTVGKSNKTYYSDSSGAYSINNLPPGTYSLTFQAQGYVNQKVSATVTANTTTTQNVTLVKR